MLQYATVPSQKTTVEHITVTSWVITVIFVLCVIVISI